MNSGLYTLLVAADIPHIEVFFWVENVLKLQIEETGRLCGPYNDRPPGVVRPRLQWRVSKFKATKQFGQSWREKMGDKARDGA